MTRSRKTGQKKGPKIAVRRNPGRMDGVRWNGDSFVCAVVVDGHPVEDIDTDVEDEVFRACAQKEMRRDEAASQGAIVVSLVDIARPAKPKGLAKEFEVVERVKRVIVLDDEPEEGHDQEDEDEDEWETIYAPSTQHKERMSYSSVLRGNEG